MTTKAEQALEVDILSLSLFGKNVNPNPSRAWMDTASEEEIVIWQNGGRPKEQVLEERLRVRRQVELYSLEQAEEDAGIRHYVPPLDADYTHAREVPIHIFTLQKMRKMGRHTFGSCVFHEDKHPSCTLYETQGYYCWVCGAHGNSIDWAMQEFGMTFGQAVEFLERY